MVKLHGNRSALVILLAISVTAATDVPTSAEIEMQKKVLLERSKRQLLWPNATLLQFNVGLATPTPLKTIAVNWVFQANFVLPWNRTQIPVDVLYANTGYDGASRSERDADSGEKETTEFTSCSDRSKRDKDSGKTETGQKIQNDQNRFLIVDAENSRSKSDRGIGEKDNVIEELAGPYDSDTGLYKLYQYVADMLNGFGYNGTDCVLRALCQIGAEPLHTDDEEDLLHELTSYVLNPNNDVVESNLPEDHEAHPFIEAYNRGRTRSDCHVTHQCTLSLVDMFTVLQG